MKKLGVKFLENWEQQGFSKDGKSVLLALSGGVDSMVLAHLLWWYQIPFAVAHCNFGLREMASDEDALFVATWCKQREIGYFQINFDTRSIAAASKQSIQVTARNLRYTWFEQLRLEHHFQVILTAHHANDVAETMLIHLCRGTGIAGLHGIPERNGFVYRPLLFSSRKEILEYASENEIAWREDASNSKTDYLRNAIRHEVLPRLEGLLPGAATQIAASAKRVADTEIIYRNALKKRISKLLFERGKDWYVPVKLLAKQEAQSTLAFELFSRFNFNSDQIFLILELLKSASGRSIASNTHRIIRNRDFLIITHLDTTIAELIQIDEVPTLVNSSIGSFQFSWEFPIENYNDDPNVVHLNGDSICFPLILRSRREGDYFYPFGMGMKKKKLKRYLIDQKIPVHEKSQIRILESGQKTLWIAGHRMDERFKVKPNTLKVLKVVFTSNNASQ